MSVQIHNETLLAVLEPGDLIEFPRGLYSHWAVYIGGLAPFFLLPFIGKKINQNVAYGSSVCQCNTAVTAVCSVVTGIDIRRFQYRP